ncbi:MAG: signal peptidase I [bacterium]
MDENIDEINSIEEPQRRKFSKIWIILIIFALIINSIALFFFLNNTSGKSKSVPLITPTPKILYEEGIMGDSSMEPLIKSGEKYKYVKYENYSKSLVKGDIIIYKIGKDKVFIKRIIAVFGDKIMIQNRKVLLNNTELKEDYVSSETIDGVFSRDGDEIVVDKDTYFVMGDNRSSSTDSRSIGLIPQSVIIGVIVKN